MDRRPFTLDDIRHILRTNGYEVVVEPTQPWVLEQYAWLYWGEYTDTILFDEVTVFIEGVAILRGYIYWNGEGYTVGFSREANASKRWLFTLIKQLVAYLTPYPLEAWGIADNQEVDRFLRYLKFTSENGTIIEELQRYTKE